MNVLMLSIDDRVFEQGSEARTRILQYGTFCRSLHVVVFTKRARTREHPAKNVFLHPASARLTPMSFFRAVRLGLGITTSPAPDTVITSQDAFTNSIGFLLKYWRGIPLRIELHTDFLSPNFRRESIKNYLRYLIYVWSCRRADAIRAVSKRIKQSVSARLGVAPEKITILPVFVDREKLRLAIPELNLHKKFAGAEPIMLAVARLSREKNVAAALAVLQHALPKHPKAMLVIVGDGPERAKLEAAARALGLADHVRFEGWREDTASYYKTADLLLVSSRYEGYGRMFVEAATAGLPIVATDVGIIGELLQPETSVLTYASPEAGARAIDRLMTDASLRANLIEHARHAVAGIDDFPAYLNAYRASLASLLRPDTG